MRAECGHWKGESVAVWKTNFHFTAKSSNHWYIPASCGKCTFQMGEELVIFSFLHVSLKVVAAHRSRWDTSIIHFKCYIVARTHTLTICAPLFFLPPPFHSPSITLAGWLVQWKLIDFHVSALPLESILLYKLAESKIKPCYRLPVMLTGRHRMTFMCLSPFFPFSLSLLSFLLLVSIPVS